MKCPECEKRALNMRIQDDGMDYNERHINYKIEKLYKYGEGLCSKWISKEISPENNSVSFGKDFFRIAIVSLMVDNIGYVLKHVSPGKIPEYPYCGRPILFYRSCKELKFFPIPDKNYSVDILYEGLNDELMEMFGYERIQEGNKGMHSFKQIR